MAMSKPLMEEQQINQGKEIDLTLCGICEGPIEVPKALPCLHTFCLSCIEEWAKGKTDKVTCPLCKEDFPLPPEGVSGFKSNFFVSSLKTNKALKEELTKSKPTCTFCDESENVAVSWCIDCKQNLCINCVKCHKTLKHLKGHNVHAIGDIRSGKVNIKQTNVTEYCSKHKGQMLWFFCETCGVIICRDCTVVDHPASKHTLVNVEDISGAQGKRMDELSSLCQRLVQEVDEAIKVANDVENDLTVVLQNARLDVTRLTAQIKDKFLENLKQKEQELMNEVTKIEGHHKSKIKEQKDTLMSQKSQLKRALEMTAHVTENGSPYDVAAMYTTLTDKLQKLSSIKPVIVPNALSKVKFVANADHQTGIPKIGTFIVKEAVHDVMDVRGEWEMKSQFGQGANLQWGIAIAEYPTGDIALADYNTTQVKVFNQDLQFKHNIDVKIDSQASHPRSIAISSDGTTYVTDESPFVKVFGTNVKLINKFKTQPPSSTNKNEALYGLAIHKIGDSNQLVVGEFYNKYVSIHTLSGSHINSFKVTIAPYSIAAAPQNTILICCWGSRCAQIVNNRGQILHNLSSSPIPGMPWNPTGAHFISNTELLIASRQESVKPGSIYHYSTKGEYLGQIVKDVNEPRGVIITKSGKLLVLEPKCLRMFKKK